MTAHNDAGERVYSVTISTNPAPKGNSVPTHLHLSLSLNFVNNRLLNEQGEVSQIFSMIEQKSTFCDVST